MWPVQLAKNEANIRFFALLVSMNADLENSKSIEVRNISLFFLIQYWWNLPYEKENTID